MNKCPRHVNPPSSADTVAYDGQREGLSKHQQRHNDVQLTAMFIVV